MTVAAVLVIRSMTHRWREGESDLPGPYAPDRAVAAALVTGVVVYAVLGGADFGSGFFDLTADSARRGAEVRTLVDHSTDPAWEANHVWLIFVLVTWWTGFPQTFAAAMQTLFLPLTNACAGGDRAPGASFAFRKCAATLRQARLFGSVFASSSVLTPFFLGCVRQQQVGDRALQAPGQCQASEAGHARNGRLGASDGGLEVVFVARPVRQRKDAGRN